MAAAKTIGPTGRSYWTVAPGSNARLFRRARRHSRIVRVLRLALPALILVATAGISVTTYLNRLLAPLPVKIDTLVVSGSKITMDHPHLRGFTPDERAYEVRADAAVQDIARPNVIELKSIDAKVQMQDASTVQLTAPVGIYDSKKETLKLDRDILITSTSGYRGRLKEARVDIKKGQVKSDHPVEMKMLQGTLKANRLEIKDSGDLIRFDHGVRMVLMLNKGDIERKVASRPPAKPIIKNESSNDTVRMALTPLPPTDPRRFASFASVPQNLVWLRLPPDDPRRLNQLVTGSIR
jgi:lipopolysaccharide export system protein LptC